MLTLDWFVVNGEVHQRCDKAHYDGGPPDGIVVPEQIEKVASSIDTDKAAELMRVLNADDSCRITDKSVGTCAHTDVMEAAADKAP